VSEFILHVDLIEWAKQLPETARLGLNATKDRVELLGVSHEMRRNFDVLASRAGVGHPLTVLYIELRDRVVKAKARSGTAPSYFHDLACRRTAYRGQLKIASASMNALIQPLGDALVEYYSELKTNETSGRTDGRMKTASDGVLEPGPIRRKHGRPPIPLEIKRRAWEVRQKPGSTLRETAQVLFATKHPTRRQMKNVSSILSYYQKTVLMKKA
jgi:hypothetical protein